MDTETVIAEILNDYFRVEEIEESFNSVAVQRYDVEEAKIEKVIKSFVTAFQNLPADGKDLALRQYLVRAGTNASLSQIKVLMNGLNVLVTQNLISPRSLCEKILLCERLVYENKNFWIESFKLIKKILPSVDYKGVRDIMKTCREKAQMFPAKIKVSNLPQLLVLEDTFQFIFDRNNCLLPAYFVANEIMKQCQDHWRIKRLMHAIVEEFRLTAQTVTIIGHQYMLPIVEHFGYADHMMNSWKLDHNTLKFNFKGSLPYDQELLEPQKNLLRYILEQPYSKEMVSTLLNLQKQQKNFCYVLEEQLVELIICAMENTETEGNASEERIMHNEWVWLHLSSQFIYFVLFQFVNFLNIIMALQEKLSERELRKGRDQLMWILLQFISGSIQKNPLNNFLPILKLLDTLYPELEPLPVPDWTKGISLRQMAPICIWIHLMKKSRFENISINRSYPLALQNHYDFLQQLIMPNAVVSLACDTDFRVILLCNAYSTNVEVFSRPMAVLVEGVNGNPKNTVGSGQPGNSQLCITPYSMTILDSLTVHSKMSLMHSFVSQMIKQAQTKLSMPTPGLIETYSRLLVYTEIEALGIKGYLSQLLPALFKHHAWGILQTVLDMFSYRLHHIPTHYRVQLLSHLHSLTSVPQTNKMQLNLCFESTALRIITRLNSAEVQPQLSRYLNEKSPGSVASTESEELNRMLIMTLARSMHITGSGNDLQPWCKDLLTIIMQNTPHSWAPHSLACFPPALRDFFTQNSIPIENKQLLKKSVDEEYRNWTSMSNENDIIAHFIRPNTNPLFLCLLFKLIWEKENISPVAYKILEGTTARALSAHLRKLCDYLVFEVAKSNGKEFIHKCVDTINDMIWKYNVVTIDRVVLCLVLRTQEGNDAQVCFLIIQLLLLKASDLRNRILDFFKENTPDHWLQSNWHEKHLAFHNKYPEKFAPDESASHLPLPVYFGNVCLRFLPVLDIVIHRFIELPLKNVHPILEVILDHIGCLYKFHDRPVTFLYNTLHFYEWILRDTPSLKKKLINSVTSSFNEVRPPNWILSEQFHTFLQNQELLWEPKLAYYIIVVKRLMNAISGKSYIFVTDWRFNEFPNPPCHALYACCVEIMSLPVAPQIAANQLIDVVVRGCAKLRKKKIHSYINAVGAIMAALPEAYWSVVYDRLQETLTCSSIINWTDRNTIYDLLNYETVSFAMIDKTFVITLAVAHSVFHHMGACKLITMIQYLKDTLKPCIVTEHQLIYLFHIYGPFLQRIEQEKPNAVAEVAIVLYELLEVVDKAHGPAPLQYIDPICDFLYHIKYIHVGDIIKNESESIIKRLRPALQMRLRFIAHLNLEDINSEKMSTEISNNSQPIIISNTLIHPPTVPQVIPQIKTQTPHQQQNIQLSSQVHQQGHPHNQQQHQPSQLQAPHQQQAHLSPIHMSQLTQQQLQQQQQQHQLQQQQQQLQQMQQQQMQQQQLQQQQFQQHHLQQQHQLQLQQQQQFQQQQLQLQQQQLQQQQQQNMGMRHN